MNWAPLTQPWGQSFRNRLYSAPLRPHRGKVAKRMAEGEGGGTVLLEKYFLVVRRGGPATDVFIMRHEYFPNKELYATKRMVHIKKEGPKEDLFYL